MKLFGYWRSSATYRVRIALALKNLDYDYEPVNLLKGEQRSDAYLEKNPLGLVPTLQTDDGALLTQSVAIIEYLEETRGGPSLLPGNPVPRAHARAIAAAIASEAQPFGNLRIQKYLKEECGFDAPSMAEWMNRWPGGAMAAAGGQYLKTLARKVRQPLASRGRKGLETTAETTARAMGGLDRRFTHASTMQTRAATIAATNHPTYSEV